MKLWVDDIREPPDDTWRWVKHVKIADSILRRYMMNNWPVEKVSLDHDLGGDDTTRPLVLFMCQYEWWPDEVVVHSANPVGREWLEKMIERYKP